MLVTGISISEEKEGVELVYSDLNRTVYNLNDASQLLIRKDNLLIKSESVPCVHKGKSITKLVRYLLMKYNYIFRNAGISVNHCTSDIFSYPLCLQKYSELVGRSTVLYKTTPIRVYFNVRDLIFARHWNAYVQSVDMVHHTDNPHTLYSDHKSNIVISPIYKSILSKNECANMIGEEITQQIYTFIHKLFKAINDDDLGLGLVGYTNLKIVNANFTFGLSHDGLCLTSDFLTPDTTAFVQFYRHLNEVRFISDKHEIYQYCNNPESIDKFYIANRYSLKLSEWVKYIS